MSESVSLSATTTTSFFATAGKQNARAPANTQATVKIAAIKAFRVINLPRRRVVSYSLVRGSRTTDRVPPGLQPARACRFENVVYTHK